MYYLNTITGAFLETSEIELEEGSIPSFYRTIEQPPEGDFVNYIYDDLVDSWSVRPLTVPLVDSITRRQGLLLLESQGLLQSAQDSITQLPQKYQIEWNHATTFEKSHPLIQQLAFQLGIPDLDEFFYRASLL